MKLNKTVKRVLIIGVLLGVIVGSWAIWYVFFKPHRNVGSEKAAYTLSSADLSKAFATDTAAVTKYIDQAILIEGPITAIEGGHISFENIICNMDSTETPKLGSLQVGQSVKVQGRLTTYNDLMEEIMMDQCILKQ
ncbi:MAG TPA: hypothetical protein VLC98_10840 [Phnomibacter sp.]|nr:hypothetical protein [Phnomibacter sp.]